MLDIIVNCNFFHPVDFSPIKFYCILCGNAVLERFFTRAPGSRDWAPLTTRHRQSLKLLNYTASTCVSFAIKSRTSLTA